jgi:hypothetical protein
VQATLLSLLLAFATVFESPQVNTNSPCVEPILKVEHIPELGEHFHNPEEACVRIMAASAQMWPSYSTVIDGVGFAIAVDDDAVVRFVSTTDPRFVTPEGLHVGDGVATALGAAPTETIQQERGWGYYIALPSGWYAFIDDCRTDSSGYVGLNLGTRPLQADARVMMFFRRD